MDWYKSSEPIPVMRLAFEPRRNDTDGLSVYRSLFVTPSYLSAAGRKPNTYYVASLRVGDLKGLGLSVLPDPSREELPGHALIPELSFEEMRRDKRRSKEIQLELARIASRAIVYEPKIGAR
jgi:hypothetical protein